MLLKHISCTQNITINVSRGLEVHIEKLLKKISNKNDFSKSNKLSDDNIVIFHKVSHKPVHLNQKQSHCLELLASGKSSKEIAIQMNISNRTVEDHIEKLMEI